MRLAIDSKIPRDEFIKFYVGNEINPNLKNFLSTNQVWKSFFQKNKDEFKNIRNRLTEISHKLGIGITDFKKLVNRVQKGEKFENCKERNGRGKFEISYLNCQKIYK